MKPLPLILLLTLFIIASCVNTGIDNKVIRCVSASDDYIDWNKTDSLVLIPQKGESDNKMVVKTAWTTDSLYVLFKVSDTNLIAEQTENDHKKLFLDDMVEVLLDTSNDKTTFWHEDDIVYHINILGFKKDDRGTPEHSSDATWNGTARYNINIFGTLNSSDDTDQGYNVEVAIPWTEIGQQPRPGLKMGVNFANGDHDCCGMQLYNWCNSDPMRSPDTYGTLVLL